MVVRAQGDNAAAGRIPTSEHGIKDVMKVAAVKLRADDDDRRFGPRLQPSAEQASLLPRVAGLTVHDRYGGSGHAATAQLPPAERLERRQYAHFHQPSRSPRQQDNVPRRSRLIETRGLVKRAVAGRAALATPQNQIVAAVCRLPDNQESRQAAQNRPVAEPRGHRRGQQ